MNKQDLKQIKQIVDSSIESKTKRIVDEAIESKTKRIVKEAINEAFDVFTGDVLNPAFTDVYNRFDKVDSRLDKLEKRMGAVEADVKRLPDKAYVDKKFFEVRADFNPKLKKQDKKIKIHTKVLKKHRFLTDKEEKQLKTLDVSERVVARA